MNELKRHMALANSSSNFQRTAIFALVAALHVFLFYSLQSGLAHQTVRLLSKGVQARIILEPQHNDRPPLPETQMPVPSLPLESPKFEVQKFAQTSPAVVYEKPAALQPTAVEPLALFNEVIVKPRSDPNFTARNLEDFYPPNARRYRVEGTAVVALYVVADGTIAQTIVEKSTGFAELDDSAIEYARTLRFLPGTRNGIAESMWFKITLPFRLSKTD